MLQYCGTTGTSRAGNVTHNRNLLDLLAPFNTVKAHIHPAILTSTPPPLPPPAHLSSA